MQRRAHERCVKDVSQHFCSVMSFLHKDSRISAKIKKSGYIGSLVWDEYDANRAELKDIALHVQLTKGIQSLQAPTHPFFLKG